MKYSFSTPNYFKTFPLARFFEHSFHALAYFKIPKFWLDYSDRLYFPRLLKSLHETIKTRLYVLPQKALVPDHRLKSD